MSKFPLDLSKFKCVASDKHTTTLKHQKGHELKLAHGGLSRDIQEKLKKLPKHYAEGTPEIPVGEDDSSDQSNASQPNQPTVVINNTPSPQQGYPVQQQPQLNRAAPSNVQELIDANNAAVARNPQSQVQQPQGVPPQTVPGQQAGMPQAPAAPGFDPYASMNAGLQSQLGGIQEQKRGAIGEAQALGQLGTQQAAQESDYGKNLQDRIDTYTQANDDLTKERTAMQADIANGHIDPDRYIKSMSTGGRILQGIGLILGGMGAGMTGGPNFAFNKMQTDIDRDIQAQRDDLGKKQNLLSNNMAQTQNLRQAMDLTRLQLNDVLSSKLRMAGDQAQDPLQKANALKSAGLLDMQSGQIQHQIAVQRAMMGGGGGGVGVGGQSNPEDAFKRQMQFLRMNGKEDLAKDMEAKHIPGIGQASKEVPPDVQKEMIARQDLQNKIVDLQTFAQKNSGSLNPAIVAQGSAKAKLLQDAVRRANAQGVFKESEKNFMEGIVSSEPTQFFQKYRSGKGYQEIAHSNQDTLNAIKQGYGLPAQQAQAEPQYKIVGGVKYMRGPNGEAVRVK